MIELNSHVAEFGSLENDLHDCLDDLGETSHEEVQASHQARVSLWFNLRASSVRLRDVFENGLRYPFMMHQFVHG